VQLLHSDLCVVIQFDNLVKYSVWNNVFISQSSSKMCRTCVYFKSYPNKKWNICLGQCAIYVLIIIKHILPTVTLCWSCCATKGGIEMETTTKNVYEREVDFTFFIRKLCGQFWTNFSTFLANSYALTWRIVAANTL